MEFNRDFTVEPLKKRCHGHKETLKPSLTKAHVMDTIEATAKQFKNGPEIRAYWAEKKRAERAAAKGK